MDNADNATQLTPEQADMRELVARLSRVQGKITDPTRATPGDERFDRVNREGRKRYQFADLPTVLQVIRPALSSEGLAFTQLFHDSATEICLSTRVLYGLASIESLWTQPMPPMPTSSKGDPMPAALAQSIKSVKTLARRASLLAIVGVVDDDMDDPDLGEQPKPTAGHKEVIREQAHARAAVRESAAQAAPQPMTPDELVAEASLLQRWAKERNVEIPAKGVIVKLFAARGLDPFSREDVQKWTLERENPAAEAGILAFLREHCPQPQSVAPATLQREASALDAERAMAAFAKAHNLPDIDGQSVTRALAELARHLGQNADYPTPRDRGVQVAKLTDPKIAQELRLVLAGCFPPF